MYYSSYLGFFAIDSTDIFLKITVEIGQEKYCNEPL